MCTNQKTQLITQEEADKIMLWLEHANRAIMRFVDSVSTILDLHRDEQVRYMPKFLPASLLHNASRCQDVAFAAI
jgi:hypothetical protein